MLRWIASTALILTLFSVGNLATADDPRLKAELTAMLTEGWQLGPDGLAAALGHYNMVRPLAVGDTRPAYAMAVVQIRQRRYPDAAATLDEVVARKKDHLTAWQAKIWLSMVGRKYDAALADMERLVEDWPVKPVENQAVETEEASRFLGRALGYLWGPASGKVAEDRLQEVEKKLADRLSATDHATFDEARAAVLGKFTTLQDKTETTREQAKQDEEKQKQLDRERLTGEKANVALEKGTIEEQALAARKVAETQLQQLGTAMQQLDVQFNRLASQAAAVQTEIAGLLAQEQALLAQVDNTDSSSERRRLQEQASFFAAGRIRAQAAYSQLDAQATGVNAQRNANLQQQKQVTSAYQTEMRRLGLKAETLVRTERRIAGEMKKAATAATGITAGVRGLSTSTAAFVTYFDFPVDREKGRILESLK